MSESGEEDKSPDCSSPEVVTKYQLAAGIANKVLQEVMGRCQAGALLVDLCDFGDRLIETECSKLYKKGDIPKGIAFPTCVSVNEIAGHFSPLSEDRTALANGDLVKIDVGVHVHGFVSTAAHSIVVGGGPLTGRVADVMMAAWTAAEGVLRKMKPGVKNTEVSKIIQKAAEAYKCNPLEGVLSHEVRQFVIDHENCIIGKENAEQKVEEFEFGPNTAFSLDIVMTTGDGKCTDRENMCTVFKRSLDNHYNLKMKASRFLLSQINKRFPTFPFTLRALEGQRAKLGIAECRNHDLVQPYPVLSCRKGELVAQFKFTCLLLPTGTLKITGLPLDVSQIKSEHSVEDEELKTLLATRFGKRKKKKKKKKKTASEDVEMN